MQLEMEHIAHGRPAQKARVGMLVEVETVNAPYKNPPPWVGLRCRVKSISTFLT